MMKRIWAIVPAAAVLAALPVLTRAADTGAGGGPDTGMTNMLIGQDAFGGWQDNKPGVWRKIGAGDLPQPFATKSASNAPGLVQRPADAVPEVPPGFKAELVASGMNAPRDMALAPDGDIFVADSAANEIVVLRMADGQAKPTAQSVFASAGLDQPYGIAFYPQDKPQWVYVGNTDSVVRFPYKSGDLKASGPAETVVGNIPSGGHWTRDIAFSKDGSTLYVAVGSGSNAAQSVKNLPASRRQQWIDSHPLGEMWGAEEGRAAVISFNPDGSNRHVYRHRPQELLGPGHRADHRRPVVRGQRARRPWRQCAVRLRHQRARRQFLRLALVLHRRQRGPARAAQG